MKSNVSLPKLVPAYSDRMPQTYGAAQMAHWCEAQTMPNPIRSGRNHQDVDRSRASGKKPSCTSAIPPFFFILTYSPAATGYSPSKRGSTESSPSKADSASGSTAGQLRLGCRPARSSILFKFRRANCPAGFRNLSSVSVGVAAGLVSCGTSQ